MRKAQKIRDLENLCQKLLQESKDQASTIIRISESTPLGIRPIFQAYVDDAVMTTRMMGGAGLISGHMSGLVIEVVNTNATETQADSLTGTIPVD